VSTAIVGDRSAAYLEHMFEGRAGEDTSSSGLPRLGVGDRPLRAGDGVSQLVEVLAALTQVDPVELPAGLALAEARELLGARAQLDALLLRRLGDVDAASCTGWTTARRPPPGSARRTPGSRPRRSPGPPLGTSARDCRRRSAPAGSASMLLLGSVRR
jgi:hypothetical protein